MKNGHEVCLLRHCILRREVPGSIPGQILGDFQVNQSFCPHLAFHRNEHQLRPARRDDISAVLVVPNFKIKVEAQNSVTRLSLHEFLRESFTLLRSHSATVLLVGSVPWITL